MSEYRLSILLDCYAGNVDEFVCAALTGSGESRQGFDEGMQLFNKFCTPFLEKDGDYFYSPVEFCNFSTEYGSMPYSLDYYTDALLLGIDSDTVNGLTNQIKLWKAAYGDPIILPRKTKPVAILGFELVEIIEKRTKL